jgi:hypothetical protein
VTSVIVDSDPPHLKKEKYPWKLIPQGHKRRLLQADAVECVFDRLTVIVNMKFCFFVYLQPKLNFPQKRFVFKVNFRTKISVNVFVTLNGS